MDFPESIGQWTGTPERSVTKNLSSSLPTLLSRVRFIRMPLATAFWFRLFWRAKIPTTAFIARNVASGSRLDHHGFAHGHDPGAEKSLGQIETTRLHNEQNFKDDQGLHSVYNLNYYWFVGYNRLTPSHIERALLDIHDRVLRGYNQRWAYVTVASNITEGLTRFGRSEGDTDAMLKYFVGDLAPQIVKAGTPIATSSVRP